MRFAWHYDPFVICTKNPSTLDAVSTERDIALPSPKGVALTIMQACQRDELPLCVIVLNLARFEAINDRHGHASGDLILKSVSKYLRSIGSL
jgi:hypothetical protein